MIKIETVNRTIRVTGSVEEINEYNETLIKDDGYEGARMFVCTNCHNLVNACDSISRSGKHLLCLTCQYRISKILGVSKLDILNLVQRYAKEIKCEQNMNKKYVDNPYQE